MSTPPASPLPLALRSAGIFALAIAMLATALLYQDNVRVEVPPDFSRGGAFAGDLADRGSGDLSISTPAPLPTPQSRSAATLHAPKGAADRITIADGPPFPALGTYIYKVDGTESASVFGSRRYAPEMQMTVDRPDGSDLTDDELSFDLNFGAEHEEREIVAYGKDAIAFTFEGGSVTFGPSTRTSEATYDPPMTQIPVPLAENTTVEGSSKATSSDGQTQRIEDWTVSVTGREPIEIMGQMVDAFIVEIDRQSQPGSSEQVSRHRKYWVDPARSIWVRFEEHMTGSQDVGLGSVAYRSDYTATLDRIEPL